VNSLLSLYLAQFTGSEAALAAVRPVDRSSCGLALGAASGISMSTRQAPAHPGTTPENLTAAVTPPIVTCGIATVDEGGPEATNTGGEGRGEAAEPVQITDTVSLFDLPQAFSSVQPQLPEQSEITRIVMQAVVDRPDLQAR
jgi:hypothetical protein